MNLHNFVLSVLVLSFVAAAAVPVYLMDTPITLDSLKPWQTWYGAILGFGGLIAVAYYNGAADRDREERRYEKETRALALAVAWEVFGVTNRAYWASSMLREKVDSCRDEALSKGWDEDGPDDSWINAVGHRVLQTYIPEPVAMQHLLPRLGHLGDLAPKVASFAGLTVQTRRELQFAFQIDEHGRLSLRNLILAVPWIEDLFEDGFALFVEIGKEIQDLASQMQNLSQKAKEKNKNLPDPQVQLVIDSSAWTGRP